MADINTLKIVAVENAIKIKDLQSVVSTFDLSTKANADLSNVATIPSSVVSQLKGETGNTGNNGINGTDGTDGTDGTKGDTGADGAKGDTGATGNNGRIEPVSSGVPTGGVSGDLVYQY